MRFFFVDTITSLSPGAITGRQTFGHHDLLRYPLSDGTSLIAPSIVCEAIGQLASWYCLSHNEFSMRPVFLFAERIDILSEVRAGQTIDLFAEITSLNRDAFRFSGSAHANGTLVQTISNAAGSFVPLEDLEDPTVTRTQFAELREGGIGRNGPQGDPYPFASLIDSVEVLEPRRLAKVTKTFSPTEGFYADHFPRFPVTPAVMLNEMIGQAAGKMLGADHAGPVIPRAIQGVKIRSFVRPGETCETSVRLDCIGPSANPDKETATITATVAKNSKAMMRATFQFEIPR